MKSVYGDEQVFLVQPTKLDYEISYGGDGVKTCQEGRYRSYVTASERGTYGGLYIQLNRMKAELFAEHNGLQLITEDELDRLRERWEERSIRF